MERPQKPHILSIHMTKHTLKSAIIPTTGPYQPTDNKQQIIRLTKRRHRRHATISYVLTKRLLRRRFDIVINTHLCWSKTHNRGPLLLLPFKGQLSFTC